MQSNNSGKHFEPDQDPYIRRWAARFNLDPDDRVVIMTAVIEQTCHELSEQFADLQHTVDERQEQWTHSLTTTNQTVQQALTLIHQQQVNQNALTQTYAELTRSLLKFEQVLTTLETRTAASRQTLPSFVSDLTDLKTSLVTVSSRLGTVSSNQTSLDTKLNDLQDDLRVSSAKGWLWLAILGLFLVSLGHLWGDKMWMERLDSQLQAVRRTANSSLIRLERLDR